MKDGMNYFSLAESLFSFFYSLYFGLISCKHPKFVFEQFVTNVANSMGSHNIPDHGHGAWISFDETPSQSAIKDASEDG